MSAQIDYSIMPIYEDSLSSVSMTVLTGKTDFIKYEANTKFKNILRTALNENNSFNYPFDSLKTVAVLVSPDKKFRIINWNLPKSDGTYEYFAFMQSYNSNRKAYDLIELIDKSDEITNPEFKTLDKKNWYGAHYYKIIMTKSSGRKYYTLLGWDGNNLLSTRKIIDVITLKSNGKPKFGYSLFRKYKKRAKRVIFEYSEQVSMSLKYEYQHVVIKSKGKVKKEKLPRIRRNDDFRAQGSNKTSESKVKRKKFKMIVFDRLTPSNPNFADLPEYNFPETNIFDGFIFKNGKWLFVKDVDGRNPDSKDPGDIEQGLEPAE